MLHHLQQWQQQCDFVFRCEWVLVRKKCVHASNHQDDSTGSNDRTMAGLARAKRNSGSSCARHRQNILATEQKQQQQLP